jgi:hypothetical protein
MGISMTGILATALALLALLLAIGCVRGALGCVAARERYRLLETWRYTYTGESTYRFRFLRVRDSALLSCHACGSADVRRVCSGTAHAWVRWTPLGCKRGPKFAYWAHRCADCDFELFRTREPYIEKSRLDYSPVEIRPDAHVLRVLTPRSDRAAS